LPDRQIEEKGVPTIRIDELTLRAYAPILFTYGEELPDKKPAKAELPIKTMKIKNNMGLFIETTIISSPICHIYPCK
jgi:hypothetical protein